jgi:hypothetical protein
VVENQALGRAAGRPRPGDPVPVNQLRAGRVDLLARAREERGRHARAQAAANRVDANRVDANRVDANRVDASQQRSAGARRQRVD